MVLTLAAGAPALLWPVSTLDEAILLVYPERMAHGDLPYRDFFAAYGPTFWWGLDAWYQATGLTITSMRVLGLGFHLFLALGTYFLLRPHGRNVAVTGSALSGVLLFRLGAAPYAWLLTTGLCVWALALARGRPAVAGVLSGLAVGVRPDVALLALVPLLVVAEGQRLRWLVGAAAGLLPVWLTLLVTPGEMVENILLGRAGKGAGQSRLPIPPLSPEDQRLLAVLLATVLLTLLWAALCRSRPSLAISLLAVLALPQAFQRADYTHFVYAGLFCLPLLPVVIGESLTRLPRPPRRPAVVGSLLGIVVFLLAVPAIPRNLIDLVTYGNMQADTVHHEGRSLPEAPARAVALTQLLTAVDDLTVPGQTLFVFDADLVRPAVNDVSLYYYLPRLQQRAYHMEITPGITTEAGSGLVEDVLAADVIVLVQTPAEDRQVLFPYARGGSEEATTALHRHFCRQEVIDRYEIWSRCR